MAKRKTKTPKVPATPPVRQGLVNPSGMFRVAYYDPRMLKQAIRSSVYH